MLEAGIELRAKPGPNTQYTEMHVLSQRFMNIINLVLLSPITKLLAVPWLT